MKTAVFLGALLGALPLIAGPDPNPADLASPKAQPTVSTAAPKADFPVIGYIEKQGKTITIKAGPKGTLYTVKSADGKVVHENLSAEQLRAQAPELHEFLKSAVAGAGTAKDARVRSGKLDASLGGR